MTDDLRRVVESMQRSASAVPVPIVTGDTKVVERGKGDGIFVTTSGIGLVAQGAEIAPARVCAGDAVLVSGDIGRHGVAVLAAREGLTFETTIESDCAPLVGPVFALLDAGLELHCLRDLTRGGLASAQMVEWDGDGLDDLVAGASRNIVWYRNVGERGRPKFAPPRMLVRKAASSPSRVVPGGQPGVHHDLRCRLQRRRPAGPARGRSFPAVRRSP